MGIIQKLEDIKEIKENIKNAIVSKGGEVTEETPFEEYAEKIEEIQTGEEFVIEYPAYLFYYGFRYDIKDVLLPRMKNSYPNYYYMFGYFPDKIEIELTVGNTEVSHFINNTIFPKYASLQHTFSNSNFTKIRLNLLDIDTEIITYYTFYNAKELTDIYCNFDYVNFNYLSRTFYYCQNLENIHFKLNLDKTPYIDSCFYYCSKLKRIDFIGRMTRRLIVYSNAGRGLAENYYNIYNSTQYPKIQTLASNCSLLETVTGLDITNVRSITTMFQKCPKLTTLEFTGTEDVKCDINSLTDTGLTRDGLMHMLATLPTLNHTQTIVIGSAKMKLLTDEDIAEFSLKGYSLA